MADTGKLKIDWRKLSSDSDAQESDHQPNNVDSTVNDQATTQEKETGDTATESPHKTDKAHPNIVPFKDSKHLRLKMKVKGGFKPQKMQKKKNTIRTAKNPFDIGGDQDSEEAEQEASSDDERHVQGEEQKPKEEADQQQQNEKKQEPEPVYKPKQKKKKGDAKLKQQAELDAIFDFIEGKGAKPKVKNESTKDKKQANEGEAKQDAKKKKKEKKLQEKVEVKSAVSTETKPIETQTQTAQQPTITIEELMKKKAKDQGNKTGNAKKRAVNIVGAVREMQERAAKAKAKKVHEDL